MTAFDAFDERECLEQRPEVMEAEIGIRSPTDDSCQYSVIHLSLGQFI